MCGPCGHAATSKSLHCEQAALAWPPGASKKSQKIRQGGQAKATIELKRGVSTENPSSDVRYDQSFTSNLTRPAQASSAQLGTRPRALVVPPPSLMSLSNCARSRQALTYASHTRACASVARCGGCVCGCLMFTHHTSALALLVYSTHVLAIGARPAATTTPTYVAIRNKGVFGHMQARGGAFDTR